MNGGVGVEEDIVADVCPVTSHGLERDVEDGVVVDEEGAVELGDRDRLSVLVVEVGADYEDLKLGSPFAAVDGGTFT